MEIVNVIATYIAVAVVVAGASSCVSKSAKEEAAKSKNEIVMGADSVAATVTITKEQMDSLKIEIGTVKMENNKVLVLSSAVVTNDAQSYIFIYKEGHKLSFKHEHSDKEDYDQKEELGDIFTFMKTEVKPGAAANGLIEITPRSQLNEGSKVVIHGSISLMKMPVNTDIERHKH